MNDPIEFFNTASFVPIRFRPRLSKRRESGNVEHELTCLRPMCSSSNSTLMYQRVRGRISDPQQEALGIDRLVPKLFANVWDALGFRILLRTIFGIGMSSILKNAQKVSLSNLNTQTESSNGMSKTLAN